MFGLGMQTVLYELENVGRRGRVVTIFT